MGVAYIYVLHFDDKLSHAQHYTGCTERLRERLTAHAQGYGSNLCRVLMSKGMNWRLGSLHSTTHAAMRRLERHLKNQANAPEYCEICTKLPKRITETTPYPIAMVPFPTRSEILRAEAKGEPGTITVRLTSDAEPLETMHFVKDLMRRDKDALGFIPAGGKEGLQIIHDKGLMAMVANNGQDVGYAAFTLTHDATSLNIHQCCISDDARLMGHGQALIAFLTEKFPRQQFTAKVRSDLAANHFWQAIGFKEIRHSTHQTSESTIVHYVRLPLL